MSALRQPANTNTRPAISKRGAAGLSTQPMCAARGNGFAHLPRQSAEACEDGEASAFPLRPLHESLDAVLTRLIDTRAEEAVGGRAQWHRPETPRPGERI